MSNKKNYGTKPDIRSEKNFGYGSGSGPISIFNTIHFTLLEIFETQKSLGPNKIKNNFFSVFIFFKLLGPTIFWV